MATVDPTQIADWARNTGVLAMADAYDVDAAIYPQFCEVVGLDQLGDRPWGTRGTTITGVGEPKLWIEGNKADAETIGQGYTWYLAAKLYGSSMEVPFSIMQSENPLRRTENLVSHFVTQFGKRSLVAKDKRVAGVMQKGTLTAGSAEYFNNSYVDAADPAPTLIYDSLPFFDTLHTQKFGSNTFANHTVARALNSANLDTTYVTMTTTNAKDERNEDIVNEPDTLVVPSNLRGTARVLLESEHLPGSANNDIAIHNGRFNLIVNRYLTDDTDAWWLGAAGAGIRVVDSGIPEVTVTRDDTRHVIHINAAYRFGVTVTDWRPWYCCNKAAS